MRVAMHATPIFALLVAALLAQASAFTPSLLAAPSHARHQGRIATKISSAVPGLRFSQVAQLRMASGPAPEKVEATTALGNLLKECKEWGLVRWVTVNPSGSVLETTADMSVGQSTFSVPGKGQYLTLASPDKLFECHINVDKAKTVAFSQDPAKVGGHTLHVMRVKDEAGAIMMSIMLQYDPAKGPGNYFEGAEAAFKAVMDKYGPEHTLCQ
mmetsp:Transcript_53091/g.125411  ORF Transcript_53091/g.125411 Transcript_53091/m.125411 type:complete len:213 (+) Transcript_53091:38-676(+)